MNLEDKWHLVGVMISDYAQGPSGMLSSDIMEIVKRMELGASIIRGDEGHTPGRPGTNYLFGAQPKSIPITMEIICPDSKLEALKEEVRAVVKAGNGSALIKVTEMETVIGDRYNPNDSGQ